MYKLVTSYISKKDGKRHQMTKTFASCHAAKAEAGRVLKFATKARVTVTGEGRIWFKGGVKGVTVNEKSQD